MSKEKKTSTLKTVILIVLAVLLVGFCSRDCDSSSSSTTTENYNDNSTTHQILAKNYLKDYLKDNLKDAKSYEEVSYNSFYNSTKGCYDVTLKYRAKNSFGAVVLEQVSGEVYFSDDTVSIRNVHQ